MPVAERCPFYVLKNEKKKAAVYNVGCEQKGNTRFLEYKQFATWDELKSYMKEFCRDKWEKCEHAKILLKYYEEKEQTHEHVCK